MIKNMIPWQCKENTTKLIHYETPTPAPKKKKKGFHSFPLHYYVLVLSVHGSGRKTKRVSAGAGATSGLPGTCRRRPAARRYPDHRKRDPGILSGEEVLLVFCVTV